MTIIKKAGLAMLVLLSGLQSASFSQPEAKKTTVSGLIRNNSVYTNISLQLPTREATVVASSPVLGDGSFSMDLEVRDPNIFKLFLADNNYLVMVLHPGENARVDLNANNLTMDSRVTGSPDTEVSWKYLSVYQALTAGIDSVENAWKENQKNKGPDSVFNILRNRYTFYDNLLKSSVRSFVSSNPGSLACMLYIDKLDIDTDFGLFDAYDKTVYPKYQGNPFIQEFHKRVESARTTAVGNLAPEIRGLTPDSVEKSLSSLKGKVVLVDFWAAWCGPCRKENPHVVGLYNKYNQAGFEVFGVSLDRDGNAWRKAIKDDGLVWTQISDLKYWKSEHAKTYGVSAIPFTVLLDRDGRIIAKKLRGEDLSKKLEEIFGF